MARRSILAATALLVLVYAPVVAQQRHWLLGTWQGRVENFPAPGRAGPERTLVVKQVTSGGKAAVADLILNSKPANLVLKIEGQTVSFATPGASGIAHKLTRQGNTPNGTWTIRGNNKSGPMWLKRK
jgi:hypothetical protein